MKYVTSIWWSDNKMRMWVFIAFISFDDASIIDNKVIWTSNSNHRSSLVMQSTAKLKLVLEIWARSTLRVGSHRRTSCKGWKTKCTWLILQKPTLILSKVSSFGKDQKSPCRTHPLQAGENQGPHLESWSSSLSSPSLQQLKFANWWFGYTSLPHGS